MTDWPCGAYGPPPPEANPATWPRCFHATDPANRDAQCTTRDACDHAMATERHRVWSRIHELAAAGDDTAVWLAAQFPTPEGLLGGTSEP